MSSVSKQRNTCPILPSVANRQGINWPRRNSLKIFVRFFDELQHILRPSCETSREASFHSVTG